MKTTEQIDQLKKEYLEAISDTGRRELSATRLAENGYWQQAYQDQKLAGSSAKLALSLICEISEAEREVEHAEKLKSERDSARLLAEALGPVSGPEEMSPGAKHRAKARAAKSGRKRTS